MKSDVMSELGLYSQVILSFSLERSSIIDRHLHVCQREGNQTHTARYLYQYRWMRHQASRPTASKETTHPTTHRHPLPQLEPHIATCFRTFSCTRSDATALPERTRTKQYWEHFSVDLIFDTSPTVQLIRTKVHYENKDMGAGHHFLCLSRDDMLKYSNL